MAAVEWTLTKKAGSIPLIVSGERTRRDESLLRLRCP